MDLPPRYELHEAARLGNIAAVESLLNANPKLADLRDEDKRLPLHWALSNNHKDIVLVLASIKSFDPDVQDGSGWTPLMIAVSLKDGEELVEFLLQKGADATNYSSDYAGQTPLHFVASKNNLDLARKLLEQRSPAKPTISDKRRQYPIHRAAATGSTPMVNLLIKYKSPINVADSFGQTPLHHAIAEGHGDTAIALLKAGADPSKEDQDKKLPLELAPDSQVLKYIIRTAESEGIELPTSFR
ncbi:BgTH12-00076 [Blumeria graminis f. sp. triticale]|uniref:BgTH12-00076 n=1 Tax=Blumeria graminis f. sp. triticale TaxID=1689686 RepID=A0A9W4D666_BLUGR|nr:BgTH12-00076 [Blumeria graminis f. sp. triticale]